MCAFEEHYGADEPPPIPAARTPRSWLYPGQLLVWVHTGTAHARLNDGSQFRLTAGEGLWAPGEYWRETGEIVTEPGTVAFPLWPHAGVAADTLTGPTPFVVPDGWRDWLIQHFSLLVTPLVGRDYSQHDLADLLHRPRAAPQAAAAGLELPALADPPSMPRAAAARAVAEELIRAPALDLTIQQWASRVASSPRTLLRSFLADTGLTFEQWRLRCRLAQAVELLTAGYGVDQVAARVGFVSRNGFTRAFKESFGSTPREFSRNLSTSDDAVLSPHARAARQTGDLARMMRGGETSAEVPRLSKTFTPWHTNNVHLLTYLYRGSGQLRVGDRRYPRTRGMASWVPAGVEHAGEHDEGAIVLPLANIDPAELSLNDVLQAKFSPAWDAYMMHCAVSARSHLKPEGYDPRQIVDLFREQLAAQRAHSVPMPADPRARAAATSFLRTIGTSGEPDDRDLPAEIHRAFRTETGMTFASWQYAARMRIARDLLAAGGKPSAIARRVGYSQVSNFSRAFTGFHGLSPRAYQQRESGERRQ